MGTAAVVAIPVAVVVHHKRKKKRRSNHSSAPVLAAPVYSDSNLQSHLQQQHVPIQQSNGTVHKHTATFSTMKQLLPIMSDEDIQNFLEDMKIFENHTTKQYQFWVNRHVNTGQLDLVSLHFDGNNIKYKTIHASIVMPSVSLSAHQTQMVENHLRSHIDQYVHNHQIQL
eukprot:29764_1